MAKTFEEWWEQTGDSYSLTVADDEDSCEAAWHARDAELSEKDARIAELESSIAAAYERGLRDAAEYMFCTFEIRNKILALKDRGGK